MSANVGKVRKYFNKMAGAQYYTANKKPTTINLNAVLSYQVCLKIQFWCYQ